MESIDGPVADAKPTNGVKKLAFNDKKGDFILSMYFAVLYSLRMATALIFGVIVYQIMAISIGRWLVVVAFKSLSFGVVSLLVTFYCLFCCARQLLGQPKENSLHSRNF